MDQEIKEDIQWVEKKWKEEHEVTSRTNRFWCSEYKIRIMYEKMRRLLVWFFRGYEKLRAWEEGKYKRISKTVIWVTDLVQDDDTVFYLLCCSLSYGLLAQILESRPLLALLHFVSPNGIVYGNRRGVLSRWKTNPCPAVAPSTMFSPENLENSWHSVIHGFIIWLLSPSQSTNIHDNSYEALIYRFRTRCSYRGQCLRCSPRPVQANRRLYSESHLLRKLSRQCVKPASTSVTQETNMRKTLWSIVPLELSPMVSTCVAFLEV